MTTTTSANSIGELAQRHALLIARVQVFEVDLACFPLVGTDDHGVGNPVLIGGLQIF